jgi:Flp pilus assembly protein TadD
MLPNDEALTISLGDNYAGLGRLTEAENAYRGLIRITGGSVEVRMRLASVLSKQGKDAEAETLLRGVVEASPRNTNGHLALSAALSRQGKSAEAEKEDRKAIELEPNNPLVLNNIAYAMLERGERLEEALKLIQRAVEAAPGDPAYLDSLGFAYYKLGKYAEGEQPLLEAARQLPNVSDIQEHLGDLYEGWGKIDHARSAFQRAVSLSTNANESARLKKKLVALGNK